MEVAKQQKVLNKAILAIKKGKVIICPTDTVYGFLSDAKNKKAVDKIFKIKKRSKQKPLPIFVKNFEMAKSIAIIDKNQESFLKKVWPGAVTVVLKTSLRQGYGMAREKQNIKLYGISKKTIALRIPKYKFLNNLLKKINKPLVQTSVNISGKPPLKNIKEIIEKFSKLDILIIDAGNLKKSKPSKIIDLTNKNKKILR